MSQGDNRIICRRCRENISVATGNCPHCGAEIRSLKGPLAMAIIGIVVIVPTVIEEIWFLTAFGVFLFFGGAYFIYDKRQRISEATNTNPTESGEVDAVDEAAESP